MVIKSLTVAVLMLVSSIAGAQVVATVDRSEVAVNETFDFTIEFPSNQTRTFPDLSPLTESFQILSTTTATRVEIVNSKTQSVNRVTATLAPRAVGRFIIPRLQAGKDISDEIEITVRAASKSSDSDEGKAVFLETEIDKSSVYVQSKILYTLRLFHRVDLREGTLSEPRMDSALVERFGDDQVYDAKRGKHDYKVIQRQYVIFPQKSGTLQIPSPIYRGRVPDEERDEQSSVFGKRGGFGSDPFAGFFRPTRLIQETGPPRSVEVKTAPTGFSGDTWLAAESLTLTDAWSSQPLSFTVGEPTTRTLTLRVKGVTASQLPQLTLAESPGFKLYTDKPVAKTYKEGSNLYAEQTMKIAIVPTEAGPANLPPIVVHWWDTLSDRAMSTSLAARSIAVQGTTQPAFTLANDSEHGSQPVTADAGEAFHWSAIAMLLGVGWLTTLVLWMREKHQRRVDSSSNDTFEAQRVQTLKTACERGDARGARDAVIRWAEDYWPDTRFTSVVGIAERLRFEDREASEQLRQLDRHLYSQNPPPWDAQRLQRALRRVMKRKPPRQAPEQSRLPALYPASS